MFRFEYDSAVFIENQRTLEAALSTDKKTQQALRKLVRRCVLEARQSVVNSIKFNNGDPRQTRQAVRSTVYRKVLGGNLNILNSKKSHGKNAYTTTSKSQGKRRGGNRMARSQRTQQILDYAPFDRAFIMRFVDSGTTQRFVGFRNAQSSEKKRYLSVKDRWDAGGNRTGNRGAIAARGFFARYGERALEIAADRLAGLIESELKQTLEK